MLKYMSQHHWKDSVQAKTSPCLTLLSIGITSDNLPLMTTLAFILLCNCLSIFTNIDKHPFFLNIIQSASLITISKAEVKLTKTLIQKDLLLNTLLHLPVVCFPVRYKISLWFWNDCRTNVPKQLIQWNSVKNFAKCIQKSDSKVVVTNSFFAFD